MSIGQTLQVSLGERSYPIYIGQDLFVSDLFAPHICGQKVMIVTNETLAPLYLKKLQAALSAYDVDVVVLPDGEQHKTLASFNTVITALLEKGHSRKSTLIALGGGVIGDLTGFAAASFMRGINFIQVPTSLLAQVDSSVGGKTGVNHPLGKNMIGAFHQPQAVIIDVSTLTTLPIAHLRAGMMEIIKHALIHDAAFFTWMTDVSQAALSLDMSVLAKMIYRSCEIKAAVVSADERETGVRALLNFGHTVGHGIEAASQYTMLHGEAVLLGMFYAVVLSVKHGALSEATADTILQYLGTFGLPLRLPTGISSESVFQHLMRDKKFDNGKVKFILLDDIGQGRIDTALCLDDIQSVLLNS